MGEIEIISSEACGIRLMVEEESGLPLIERVTAGKPFLAMRHIKSHYQVDPALFKPHADFLLRVNRKSMTDTGIMDGELLAVP